MTYPLTPVDFDDEIFPYVEALPDNGKPPLLCIHGFLSSRAQWMDNIEGLCEFARPIIVEQLNHGRSPKGRDKSDYGPEKYTDYFETIRMKLGLESWSLCGHSFGAALALDYALAKPEVVNAVIVTNSVSAFRDPAISETMRESASAIRESITNNGKDGLRKLPFHPRFMRRVSAPLLKAIVEDSKGIDPAGIATAFFGDDFANASPRDQLPRLKPPVLLVNGALENSFQPYRDWVIENLPNFEVIDFPNAGHNVNAEEPEAFNKTVKNFLARLPA